MHPRTLTSMLMSHVVTSPIVCFGLITDEPKMLEPAKQRRISLLDVLGTFENIMYISERLEASGIIGQSFKSKVVRLYEEILLDKLKPSVGLIA